MRARRTSNRGAALVLALGLLTMTVAALGQQASLEVRSPSAKLLDTSPGRIVTTSVTVANRGAWDDDEIIETLSLPPGCRQVAPAGVPFRLPPRGQIVRLLAVAVPANMPAGRFPMRYLVRSRRDPSSIGSIDFSIQVAAVDNLELVIEPRTGPVLAGDSYPVVLRVTNHGNSRLEARLSRRSSLDFQVSMEAPEFSLAGGASRVITCTVRTDKTFASHTSHAVTFDIVATSAAGKTLTASQASVAEIIPLRTGKTDPYHHLPVVHRIMAFGATGEEGQVQMELSGAGTLDEAGKHRIDFMLRGPDATTNHLFGERDEFGASYHSARWDLDFGDRIYELSPLTERHSLGRGAGITWRGDKTTVGGFYMTTRFRRHDVQELAAYARHDFTKNFSLQGNFMRKTGGDPALGRSLPQNIMTVESHYRAGRFLNLETELGASRGDDGSSDFAARVAADGEAFGFNYSLEMIHAGPQFYGYYHNTDTIYSSVSKAITDRLRVHASFNRYSGNLELNDILSTVVNEESSWNVGADYRLSKVTELSLDWQHTRREDVLVPAAYDFVESSVRTGVSHSFGKLQLQGAIHLGVLDNSVTRENAAFQRVTGTLNWQPSARHSYSLYGSYGPSAFTGSTDKAFEAGVTGNWNISERLAATVSYALNQYDGLVGSEQNQALASVRYQFKNKSSISIVGRWSRATSKAITSSASNVTALMVTYSMPFDLAVSRKRSIGGLRGRLTNASAANQAGVPRVVLQIGDKLAVTDETGAFEFPELTPGPCELQVRQDSLGPHLALATPLPMKIKIRPADTTFVELQATPASSITVAATRFAFADGKMVASSGDLREAGGQEGVVVEITNGRDVWHAQTDRLGQATFDRLPAGQWELRAAAAELPPLHAIEQPRRTVTLKPGQTEIAAVRILPQRRTLRLLDGGAIR